MIAQSLEYAAPATLAEALKLIDGGAKPLAGGMSLDPHDEAAPRESGQAGGHREAERPELHSRRAAGAIHIGAASTHYEVETSALIRGKCLLLGETAAHIGDVQVRNMGTIGGQRRACRSVGRLSSALPALEAGIVLKSAKAERTVSAADFFVDTFTTALQPGGNRQ